MSSWEEWLMQYIGVDIIEIARVEKAVARWGERFLHRIYTDAELKLYRKKPSSLAARFATKEAVMKLLGTGRKGVCWRDIETLSHPSGKPLLNLLGRAQVEAKRLGLKEIAISLSHSKEYAIALVSSETR
jgi:holo-[acyl-carrier protein] synthase